MANNQAHFTVFGKKGGYAYVYDDGLTHLYVERNGKKVELIFEDPQLLLDLYNQAKVFKECRRLGHGELVNSAPHVPTDSGTTTTAGADASSGRDIRDAKDDLPF